MKEEKYDMVVIGSGIAGLFYAIQCAAFSKVLIVTKGNIGESNTMYAQGGIAAVMNDKDSIESHVADTLQAGDGMCDRSAVELIAKNARQAISDLVNLHVHFNKTETGDFDLHREGGHSRARIVHHADATGKEVETRLVDAVRHHPNITILENHFVVDLIVENNTCLGVQILHPGSSTQLNYYPKLTMLATGGAGQIYAHNTNPSIATGDGFAMAYRAGACMMDMEFVQFHPTTLYSQNAKDTFLITEAVRGFGAELKNKAGETFMETYHPMKSLAPRDIVTRAIVNEMANTGEPCVYLDLRNFDTAEIQKHFPNIYARCREEGLNLRTDMIPVTPAAHYMCGGIKTDVYARTSINNLYACGECAGTGVHGANRLASNSLLEGLVFATTAAADAKKIVESDKLSETLPVFNEGKTDTRKSGSLIYQSMKVYLQNLMWNNAGIIRTQTGLEYCLEELEEIKTVILSEIEQYGISQQAVELLNMVDCSQMVAHSALQRKESRGCHYRSDYPNKFGEANHTFMQGAIKNTQVF
ncbi:MAG: L-aspartate oxidase [Chitinophagales bacterium]|nr:L-aspartate oxidase [Chitinophagales bacterium]